MLRLDYQDYATNRDRLLEGLSEAVKFINEQCIYTAIDLPYTSQLIPLSVLFAIDKNLWFSAHNRRKLEMWYWCGVFGELYGSANEGRYVNDVVGMIEWICNDDALPDTVLRSNFHASRLQQLYTRNSAAYKGVMALILKAGAKDFLKGTDMSHATYTLEYTDIHHIFPQHYCEKKGIDRARWNSVINKTPRGISVLISVVICLFPSFFISLFNRDPNVVQIGNGYLRTVSVFYLIFAAMQILNGLLLGYGKSFVPMIASVGSLCLLQVPTAIILSGTELAYRGIWIAAPVGWLGGLLIRYLYFRHIARNQEEVLREKV